LAEGGEVRAREDALRLEQRQVEAAIIAKSTRLSVEVVEALGENSPEPLDTTSWTGNAGF
jgi:hypothetical protein